MREPPEVALSLPIKFLNGRMSRKKNDSPGLNPAESKDEMITNLIQQRKLQQDALLKIMDSMEKEKEPFEDPITKETPRRKRMIEKIFSTDKKKQKRD